MSAETTGPDGFTRLAAGDVCPCAHVPSIPGAPDVSCPRCTPVAAEEFPMMVTEAKLHTMSNTGDMETHIAAWWRTWDGPAHPSGHEVAAALLASDWLADLIAAAERRGATQRAQKIAAAMETASHTHRPDRPIWLHAARIARNTR